MPAGIPVHVLLNPGLVQVIVDAPALPLNDAVPVHAPPVTLRALIVKLPLNVLGSVVPLIVPVQLWTSTAQVPFTPDPACVRLSVIACCAQLFDSKVPVQEPAMFAGGGGLGAVGVGLSRLHPTTHRLTRTAIKKRVIVTPSGARRRKIEAWWRESAADYISRNLIPYPHNKRNSDLSSNAVNLYEMSGTMDRCESASR